MANTRYRRKGRYSQDMAYYAQLMAEDNGEELSILKQNLARALQEDVTPRQREMLQLYYGQGMTMREIACYLQVDRTTVSRTIKRGEQRLRRCLRYGGAGLLQRSLPEPKKAVRQKNNPNS